MLGVFPRADLLLLRHGESVWNAEGRWQGQADPPLSARGVRTACAIAELLAPARFGAIYCSDLSRARQTAELIATALGAPAPVADGRLRERDIGRWAGLTDAEISARWSGQPQQWRTAEASAPPSGGETAAAVVRRALESLAAIRSAHGGARILVVSHGGLIRSLDQATGGVHPPVANLAGLWFGEIDHELTAVDRFEPNRGTGG